MMNSFSDDKYDFIREKWTSIDSHWIKAIFTGDSGQKTKEFVTGSKYYGHWDNSTRCMNGYGVYKYPDGSTYRGYFKNGLFNGLGTLHLMQPYNMIFNGTFENGILLKAHQIKFGDNLEVYGTFSEEKMNFHEWTYCSKNDRRFAVEQAEGIPPVGPTAYLTAGEPRNLKYGEYDVMEGIFRASTGLITNRPPPFPPFAFVNCKTAQWIKQKCRIASCAKIEVTPKVCSQIIKNNQEMELELEEYPNLCNYDANKPYYGQFQRNTSDLSIEAVDCSTSNYKDCTSVESAEKDVFERLYTTQENGKKVFGRFPEDESMYMFPIQGDVKETNQLEADIN